MLMHRIIPYRGIGASITGLFLLLACPSLCLSQERSAGRFHGMEMASDKELDGLRGGFILPNGMTVNISIDQNIFRNGIRQHTSYFELPDQFLSAVTGQVNPGNPVTINALGSITQNALNNQLIEIMRIVDIELLNVPSVNLDTTGLGLVNPFSGSNF